MKKSIFLILFQSIVIVGIAQPVSTNTAIIVASNYLNGDSNRPQFAPAYSTRTDSVIPWLQISTDTCIYVVNMANGGWALVAADQRAIPILAINATGQFPADTTDMPPGMIDLLRNYVNEITYIKTLGDTLGTHPQWQALITNDTNYVAQQRVLCGNANGSPNYTPNEYLLNNPARGGEVIWTQSGGGYNCDKVYNKFCPQGDCSKRCYKKLVGCVAVAIAQIMWYWQWPYCAWIPNSINSNDNTLHIYDWDKMPHRLTENTPINQVDMVAGFLRDCGYASNMNYGCDESGTTNFKARQALRETFDYEAGLVSPKFLTPNWKDRLREEINAGRPVYYSGSGNGAGHAFVIDGYEATNPSSFHINFGWGGIYNGFFVLSSIEPPNLNYNSGQAAIMGIYPKCSTPDDITISNETYNTSSPYLLRAHNSVTLSNTTVTGNLQLVAGEEIRLRPGFHATAGSLLDATIKSTECGNIPSYSYTRNLQQNIGINLHKRSNAVSDMLVNQTTATNITVFPNPVKNILFVSGSNISKLELYSVNGQKLLQTSKMTLQISNLSQGIYILKIYTETGVIQEKIIKQ